MDATHDNALDALHTFIATWGRKYPGRKSLGILAVELAQMLGAIVETQATSEDERTKLVILLLVSMCHTAKVPMPEPLAQLRDMGNKLAGAAR